MSTKYTKPTGLGFVSLVLKPAAYIFLFGTAVLLFSMVEPEALSDSGAIVVAMWVSVGATILATTVATLTGPKTTQSRKGSGLTGLLLTAPVVALSSFAFWTVSLEASMLLAAVAQPLRVLMETAAAGTVMSKPGQGLKWDRMFFDSALGFILLSFVLANGQIGSVSVASAIMMVIALVVIGMLSELLIMRLQLKEPDEQVHPAKKVATINGLLTLVFFTIAIWSGTETLLITDWTSSLLLATVGAIGTAAPTIVKLLLVRDGHNAQDVSILALGFSGAVSASVLIAMLVLWVVGFFVAMPAAMAALASQLGSTASTWVSVLVGIFVVTRFWVDNRPTTPSDPMGPQPGQPRDASAHDVSEHLPTVQDGDWASRTHPEALEAYHTSLLALSKATDAQSLETVLTTLLSARRAVGHAGFVLLPAGLLRAALQRLETQPDAAGDVRDALQAYDAARLAAQGHAAYTSEGRMALSIMEKRFREMVLVLHRGSLTLPWRMVAMGARRGALSIMLRLVLGVAAVADPFAAQLRKMPGQTGLEVWTNALASVLEHFASKDALLRSGVETSVGFRFVIPGTGGLIANAGLWIMIYSGSLQGYLTRSNPMLLNPGFTLATPVWILTWNRPGLGMGPSLPFGNAYLDSQRYKLLLGADGVGYVRVGHWEGRGAYGTVSGSLPLMLGLRGTWNASLFSPGLEPVVARSTPLARWIRAKSVSLNRRLFGKVIGAKAS